MLHDQPSLRFLREWLHVTGVPEFFDHVGLGCGQPLELTPTDPEMLEKNLDYLAHGHQVDVKLEAAFFDFLQAPRREYTSLN